MSGTGYAVIDGEKQPVKAGDVIQLPVGVFHTVYAETELKIIEVQLGSDISVEDKEVRCPEE